MDRTIARRIYNEFTSEIDLSKPGGVARSGDVDAYIEKALKPLIEEGKAFKRISVNRRTGIRSTRYSYQGGKKIQDSINAILDEMPANLGYVIDPDTGNIEGTDKPPPVAITNRGRHYYNETRERILDPRTAASIKAQALRAGGVSTTDKASGYTTTLVRAGLSGETRTMRKLVDDTDKKYLGGELPSSALADGASPATVEERVKAQVARKSRIEDARETAILQYIKANPNSRVAIEELRKRQKISDREDKARILTAERTPGTPEFRAAVSRRLDKRSASNKETVAWAKRNRRDPMAKLILRNDRNKSPGGRLLNRMSSIMRTTAITAIVSVIAGTVKAAFEMLKTLPSIAGNVHKLAVKGTTYNVPDGLLKKYEKLGNLIAEDGSGEGLVSSFLGNVHNKLSSIINGNLTGAIGPIAALSGKVGGRAIRSAADYYSGAVSNPEQVMLDTINDAAMAAFKGITSGRSGVQLTQAISRNERDIREAYGNEASDLFSLLFKRWGDIGDDRKATIRTEVEQGGDFVKLMMDYLGAHLTSYEFAGDVDTERANNVGNRLRELRSDAVSVRDGILTKILANMDPVVSLLRQILRGILNLAGLDGALIAFNEQAAVNNMFKIAVNERQLAFAEVEANRLREKYGMTDSRRRENAILDFADGMRPGGMSWEEASEFYEAEMHLRNVFEKAERFKHEDYILGRKDVYGTEPEAYAGASQRALVDANRARMNRMERLITAVGTDPEAIEDALIRTNYEYLVASQTRLRYQDLSDLERGQALIRDGWVENNNGFPVPARRNPVTGEQFYDPESFGRELSGQLQMLHELKELLSHDSTVTPRALNQSYRRGIVLNGETLVNHRAVLSEVVNEVMSVYGESMGRLNAAGAARVEVALTNDKMEHVIIVRDAGGRQLAPPIRSMSTLVTQNALQYNPFNIDWTSVYEAHRPTR